MHYEMEDLMEQAAEVQESMSRTYGVPDELDETDLEAGMLAINLQVFNPIRLTLPYFQNWTPWEKTMKRKQVSRHTCAKM